MRRHLRTYDDPTLARKMTVVRGFSLLLLAAFAVLMASVVRSGEITATTRSTWSTPGSTRTVTWADSPIFFLFQLFFHVLFGLMLIGAVHLVIAIIVERRHTRASLRRKSPS